MKSQNRTWWGHRFIESLEQFTDAGRLSRGRAYSRDNRILEWKMKNGKISAKIRGNANPYYGVYEEPIYNTEVSMTTFKSSQWQQALGTLTKKASFVSQLMLGEMPDHIEEVFSEQGLRLLPQRKSDFHIKCSCPDWGDPCKHGAGVCYRLANILDDDPLLLFELRGLDTTTLHQELSRSPLGEVLSQSITEDEATPGSVDSYYIRPTPMSLPATQTALQFWNGQDRLPEEVEPVTPAVVPAILVKKGGRFPSFWNKKTDFTEVMEEFYLRMRKNSQKRL